MNGWKDAGLKMDAPSSFETVVSTCKWQLWISTLMSEEGVWVLVWTAVKLV